MIDAAEVQASKQRSRLQALLLGVGVTMLLCISVVAFWLVNLARSENAAMQTAVRTETAVSDVLLYLRRAESAQRGFLLSENERYLETFEDALHRSDASAGRIDAAAFADPADRAVLDHVRELATQKAKELRETVDLQRYGARDESLAVIKTDVGENLMREITAETDRLRDHLHGQTVARGERSQLVNMVLLGVSLASIVGIVVVAALSARMSRSAVDNIETARRVLREANAMLERRVAERTADLQEANAEIQRFAYIVSHDLRSPLVNIMGFTSELEALRDDVFARLDASAPDDPKRADIDRDFTEAFGFIKASTAKMDGLINAILKLARQGRRALQPATVDLAEMASAIGTTLQHQLSAVGATIEVQPMPVIESDRLAIEQILTNLLDNAVKYLRADEPGRIEVRASEAGDYVILEIEDNGRGIDAKDKERVFDLFRRSGKQDKPGDGIGLAHVRGMVRRLGGAIALESELGRGTVFRITLPRHLVAEQS